ncbi:MAG: hypothetical protein M1839_000572 [Geoglossum umbratile]|nr:MAG: hypothetical protein M1839_000572 [Geoglossum umbratile]
MSHEWRTQEVVLIEEKRGAYEIQASKWAEALDQLTKYSKLVRAEQGRGGILRGIITVGTYVRFYYFVLNEQQMKDYPAV